MTAVEVQPVSLSSGHSKMDDKKRPATYDQDDSPPLKRQATGANGSSRSHHDTDIPGKDDLERFQKEAIYRQMQEYKREKATLESNLNDLKKRSAHHDDHLRIVHAWFSQLLDEVKLLCGNVQDGVKYSGFPSMLLISDNSSLEKHLQSQANVIESAVKEIFSKTSNDDPAVSELKERIAELLAAEKTYVNDLEKIRLEKEQMEERLETASMRYMIAEKKLDRMKSATVAKLERQALQGGSNENGSGIGGGTDGTKNENVKIQVDTAALAETEVALKEAVAASAKQVEQLKQLEKDNQDLSVQLTQLKLRSSQHTDDDYAHTELFRQAKKQLEDVVHRVNGLEAANAELRQQAKKLQAERAAYRTEVDAELHGSMTEKDLQLTKAESDLARIRAARDELYAELQIRKQAQDQDKASTEQLKQILAAKDERINTMESEIERLRSSQTDSRDMNDLPLEELRSKYGNMEKQLSMMNQELGAMSAAYKKLSSSVSQKVSNLVDMEEKVARAAAEKSKADQKYFGAMKLKDAREQEVRTLRAQNSKSSEIVAQLKELETSSRQLVHTLEKQNAESKDAFTILESKHQAVQTQISEKNAANESLKKQMEEMKTMLQAKEADKLALAASLRTTEVEVEKLKISVVEKVKQAEAMAKFQSSAEDDDVIQEQLRTMALCNVCRKNWKDTALKTCGHLFCKDCVDDRVANRLRKCPNCNKNFGINDLMKVSL